MEDTAMQHVCGPECEEQAKQMRGEIAENLLRSTPKHRRAEVTESSRVAAEMARHALPTMTDDQRALTLEFTAGVLAKVMMTPVASLSDVVDTTMVAYSVGAAILAAGYVPPAEGDELPAPETPDEELPQIDLRQTGQYL